MTTTRLTPAQLRRLVKLAQATGRKPEDMLRFVLREELGLQERDVRAVRTAYAAVKQVGTQAHPDAEPATQALIKAARLSRSRPEAG